ncbi:MAG: hypothetical protein AAGD14_04530 [Planctomycetota bacterium]
MRLRLAFGSLCVLVVVLLIALIGNEDRSRGDGTQGRDAPSPTPRSPEPRTEAIDDAAAPPPEFGRETFDAVSAGGATGARRTLSGDLSVQESDGSMLRELDGTLTLLLWRGGQGRWHEVDVRGGKWSVAFVEGQEISAAKGRLAKRAIAPDLPRQPIPKTRHLSIVARWSLPSTLEAIDAETRRPIGAFELVKRNEWRGWDARAIHPGARNDVTVLAAAARSPYSFPESTEENAVYWVRAEGYAWQRIEVNHVVGGERTIALARSGSLRVEVVDLEPDAKLHVRLRSTEGRMRAEATARPQTSIEFDDVRPGRYLVRLERGVWAARHPPLDEIEVEVRPGNASQVTLRAAEAAKTGAVIQVGGTLRFLGDWRPSAPKVRVSGSPREIGSEATITRQANGIWRWDASIARTPTARAYVSWHGTNACHLEFPLEGIENGTQDAVLEVPAPADVVLRLRDGEDDPIELSQLEWRVTSKESVVASGAMTTQRSAQDGAFRFRAIAGRLRVYWRDPRFRRATEDPTLQRGPNTLIVRVARRIAIPIRERHAGSDLPPIPDPSFRIRREGASGWSKPRLMRTRDGLTIFVDAPGRYELRSERAGFAPALVGWTVSQGETNEPVVLDYKRE